MANFDNVSALPLYQKGPIEFMTAGPGLKRFVCFAFFSWFWAGPLPGEARNPSPVFYHTENSDDWVEHTIHVERRYTRVLVVDSSRHPPRRLAIPVLDLNSRKSVNGATRQYPVFAVF